jgi:regulator of protease activity HflC (stomatin/prohibitin superfamily)
VQAEDHRANARREAERILAEARAEAAAILARARPDTVSPTGTPERDADSAG